MADDALALLVGQVIQGIAAKQPGPVTELKARQNLALDAQQRAAYDAAYDAHESVAHPEDIDFYIKMSRRDGHGWPSRDAYAWPISGDDLALARAGKTA